MVRKKEVADDVDLFAKYDRSKPDELRQLQQELLIAYEPFVEFLASKFKYLRGGCPDTAEDIKQCARMGIMEAARHYNPDNPQKASFLRYCTYWANKYIYDYIDNDKTIRLPKHVIREITKRGKQNNYSAAEAAGEIGEEMGLNYIPISVVSISEGGNDDDSYGYDGIDLERELMQLSEVTEMEYIERTAEHSEILREFFKDEKNLRNLMIFEDSIGENPMSTRELGEKYGLHHTQVANILNGKKVNGKTVIEPFVEKFKKYIIEALKKEGIEFSEYSYEAFVRQFLIIKERVIDATGKERITKLGEGEDK